MSISVEFEQGNSSPRIVRIRTSSTLAQVTAAGWYKNVDPNRLVPSDKVEIYYSEGSSLAANAFFDVAIAAGVVTLSVAESNVILPVVDGDFAVFSGTSGAIDDRGYLPSDATKTRVVMAGSAVVINDIAHFVDTTGTIDDTAAAVTNRGNIYAGASGTAGAFRSYSSTATRGYLGLTAVANAADHAVVISNASHGQASTISIPDGGQASSNFIISNSASTQTISTGNLFINQGDVRVGSDGFARSLYVFPATADTGNLRFSAVDNLGDYTVRVLNAAHNQASTYSIPDSGASTANFLLDTGPANIIAKQEFVGLSNVLTFGTGTWTVTRIAQGNYVSRHTPGDETSIIGIDITPAIVIAASKGFRLDSFDVIYAIAANALDAHSVVLDRIVYANNVAVSVTSVPVTGALATATQANPYVTNVVVDTPAFLVTADSKYVIELTVNNAAASEYDYYGIMLRFSQTIA